MFKNINFKFCLEEYDLGKLIKKRISKYESYCILSVEYEKGYKLYKLDSNNKYIFYCIFLK